VIALITPASPLAIIFLGGSMLLTSIGILCSIYDGKHGSKLLLATDLTLKVASIVCGVFQLTQVHSSLFAVCLLC
jgi:hypothetical protein